SPTELEQLNAGVRNVSLSGGGAASTLVADEARLSGTVVYSVPGPGSSNFTSPTAWTSRAFSAAGVTSFVSQSYFSPALGNYSGIVSVVDGNSTTAGRALLSTVPMKVFPPNSASIHLTYRATDTLEAGTKGALYISLGIDSQSNGKIDKTLTLPVNGLSGVSEPQMTSLENLTGDGVWHTLTLNIGKYLPSTSFLATMTVNATTTRADMGTISLQVSNFYLQIESNATAVLAAAGTNSRSGGDFRITSGDVQIGFLSSVVLSAPVWVSGQLQANSAGGFEVSFGGISFTSANTASAPVTAGWSILAYGPNDSLTSAEINGASVPATPTRGGYVITQTIDGPADVTLSYLTVQDSLSVVDALGNPIGASLTVSDDFGHKLLAVSVPGTGLVLQIIPGRYVYNLSYDGNQVGSRTVQLSTSNSTRLQASVLPVSFVVEDILGRPVQNSQVTVQTGQLPSRSEFTNGKGVADFEFAARASYNVGVSIGGSRVYNQTIVASTPGAVIVIQSTSVPEWIYAVVILLVVGVPSTIAIVNRLFLKKQNK
ncbi:MAG TPA: hypothetical protein VFE91_02210, partial [Nitrososphaerales archaeon]|nr:hypothetical protein [Nitrososphaerales archaeon]